MPSIKLTAEDMNWGTNNEGMRTIRQHNYSSLALSTARYKVSVYNALINLNITKATGPDNIPPIVLSKCASVLCKPLLPKFKLWLPSYWLEDVVTI